MKKITLLSIASFLVALAISTNVQAQVAGEFSANITSSNNILCFGTCIGTADVAPMGGTAPYRYLWNDGDTNSHDSNMCANSYTVMVTDSAAIDTAYAYVTITQPTQIIVSVDTVTPVTCWGDCNGRATVSASGGTPPYKYLWVSDGDTLATDSNLCRGYYQVIITDSNGCEAGRIVHIGVRSRPVSATGVTNASCFGDFNGMSFVVPSGGVAPYQFLWMPGGDTSATAAGLGAGTYTVTVTDALGCTSTNSTAVGQPAPLTLSVTSILSYAAAFAAGGTSPYTYHWYPVGSTSSFVTGLTPGTYTVTVNDSNFCSDSAIINITSSLPTLPSYSQLRSPRWSKRGMYVEFAAHYYNPDSISVYGTPLVTFCRNNKITYVLLDGVDNDPSVNPIGPFYLSVPIVNPTYAGYLANFIDSLKTRGGVDQVGVVVYNSNYHRNDTNAYSVRNYDVHNYSALVNTYNIGIPWEQKVDIISLDEEFWLADPNQFTDTTAVGWAYDIADFDSVHLPMLRSMWNAAHSCDKNFLRVEDYIEPALNPMGGAVLHPDSVYTNWCGAMEMDSIGKYTDRILLSSYTSYPEALWNRGDWIQGDSEMGANRIRAYYKKEIWPVFDPANLSDAGCPYCGDQPFPQDFLGGYMCANHVGPVKMEQRYYDSLSVSWRKKVFTNNLNGGYAQDSMKADTCFRIEGSMWFQYACLKHWKFETIFNSSDTAIQFDVTVGHDRAWLGINDTLIATPHGGTPPFIYIWYDEDNHDSVVRGADTNRKYIATYPSKYSVLAIDLKDSAAYDYVILYSDTCYPSAVSVIAKPDADFKVYPNPASSQLNIKLLGLESGVYYFHLYDIMGQQVKTDELKSTNSVLNISSLTEGMYFYRITNSEGRPLKSDKLVIIH